MSTKRFHPEHSQVNLDHGINGYMRLKEKRTPVCWRKTRVMCTHRLLGNWVTPYKPLGYSTLWQHPCWDNLQSTRRKCKVVPAENLQNGTNLEEPGWWKTGDFWPLKEMQPFKRRNGLFDVLQRAGPFSHLPAQVDDSWSCFTIHVPLTQGKD